VSDTAWFDLFVRDAFFVLLFIAAVYDIVSLRLPNALNGALFLLFFPAAVGAGLGALDWLSHLGGFVATLCFTALGFHFRIIGGGDAKLLAVGALWTGIWPIGFYLLAVALLGGVVAVVFWALRKALAMALVARGSQRSGAHLPEILLDGAGVPYGVAIAAGLALTALAPPLWFGDLHAVFFTYFHK
jgi:prepilin peptidase CpaA